MLRPGFFVFAALQAVGCLSAGRGIHDIIIIVRVSIMVDLLCVHRCKQIGDGDILRATARAIAADA